MGNDVAETVLFQILEERCAKEMAITLPDPGLWIALRESTADPRKQDLVEQVLLEIKVMSLRGA